MKIQDLFINVLMVVEGFLPFLLVKPLYSYWGLCVCEAKQYQRGTSQQEENADCSPSAPRWSWPGAGGSCQGQLPLGTGWGSRKSLSQGGQPRALDKCPVAAGGSRGRLPCYQHPCRSRAKRVSHPRGRRGFCKGEDWAGGLQLQSPHHLEGNTFSGVTHSFHSSCSLHRWCPHSLYHLFFFLSFYVFSSLAFLLFLFLMYSLA